MPRRNNISNADAMIVCSTCGGSGQVPSPEVPGETIQCPNCAGLGRVVPGMSNKASVSEYEKRVARSAEDQN